VDAKATAAGHLTRALETLRGRGASRRAPAANAADPSLVTEQDVEACYRLLHGRAPDEDGRQYWAAAVGRMTVAELVGAFVDSREFHLGDLYRRIAAARPVETSETGLVAVDLPGRVQYVDPDDQFVGAAIVRDRVYEPHLTRAISDVLKEGDGFIDVGANIGWFSLLAASIVGVTGRVLAVEADPANVGLVLRSAHASGFGNVRAVSAAAGATSGAMLLQRAGGSNGVVYLSADAPAPGDRWVPAVTLDSLSGMMNSVRVVKVDVEGAELLVLWGASEMITRYRPVVFVEFSPGMLSRFEGSGTRELQSWLDEHDYRPAIVTFDGGVIDLPSLLEAEEYCRRGSYQHVDLQLTP
jgi:FkbM family methyltransferase